MMQDVRFEFAVGAGKRGFVTVENQRIRRTEEKGLLFRMLGFIDASLDLTNLLGDRNLFWTDLRTFPQGLTPPRPVLVIQEGHPVLRTLIP